MKSSPGNQDVNEQKMNRTGGKRALCLVTVGFTVVVALLITTFVLMWTLIPRSALAPGVSNVCQSEACISESARLLRTVDLSVDPCHDFYSFACGRLMRRPYNFETIQASISAIGDETALLNSKMFELFYNADLASSDDPEMNQMYQAVRRIFLSCVSFHKPDLWKGLWKASGDHVLETKSNLTVVRPLIKWLDEASSIEELMAVLVRTDTSGFIHLKTGILPTNLYFEAMKFNFRGQWNKSITNEVRKLMSSLKVNITSATELVKSQNKLYGQNITNSFIGTLMELENATSKHQDLSFNWTLFLNKLDLSNFDPKMTIKVDGFGGFVEALKSLSTEFRERNESLYDFLRFDSLMALGWLLPMENYPLLLGLYEKEKTGIDETQDETEVAFQSYCVTMAQTSMQPVVNEMFEKAYTTKNSSLINLIVSELQVAMKQNVDSEVWIQSKIKQLIKDRIDYIESTISYYRMPTAEIKTMFRQSMQMFNRSKTFGDLVLFYLDAKFRKIMWIITSKAPSYEKVGILSNQFVINAFYYRNTHSLHIVAGILETYLYNEDYPEYLLYGGIGTVIGHEIAHAFDPHSFQSIQIPRDENKTIFQYYRNSMCLMDSYSQMMIVPNSTRVNGTITVGENFADIVGINAAFKAYKNKVSAHQKSLQLLPGPVASRLSPDQLFFVQAAQFNCERGEKDFFVKKYVSDEHSPQKPRVIGLTQHSKYFSNVFQCKPGDSMYLTDSMKCHNW